MWVCCLISRYHLTGNIGWLFDSKNCLWYAIIFLCAVLLYLGKVVSDLTFFACFTLSQHKIILFFVYEFRIFVCKFYYLS